MICTVYLVKPVNLVSAAVAHYLVSCIRRKVYFVDPRPTNRLSFSVCVEEPIYNLDYYEVEELSV